MSESEKKEKPVVLVDPSSADDYTCHICMELLENPKDISRCGHTFCLQCITKALSITPACPLCREPTSADALLEPNIIFKGQLEKLQVYCSNRPECNWIGKKGDLNAHLASKCEFQLLPCPNSKIHDLPACPEEIYRSAVQSHLKNCQFEQLKPFFAKLVEHCIAHVRLAEDNINLVVSELKSTLSLKVNQLKDNLNMEVNQLRQVQDNCNRVLNVSTKTPYSLPLPPLPITDNHYINIHPGNSCDQYGSSVIISGCTYRNEAGLDSFNGLPNALLFDVIGLKPVLCAVNNLAKLGYSILLSGTSIKRDHQCHFSMEYTGVKWSNDEAQSGVELPPYVLITPKHILPSVPGLSVQNSLALANSLVAKHPYRIVKAENRNYLLQKCPAT